MKCATTTRAGEPCRAWAVVGSDPPRCVAHGGSKGRVGAPRGNQNARKHGFYSEPKSKPKFDEAELAIPETVEDIFYGLARCQAELAAYYDEHKERLSFEERMRLIALYAQNASRLARIARDMDLKGLDELEQAVDQVLDELGGEWEIKL